MHIRVSVVTVRLDACALCRQCVPCSPEGMGEWDVVNSVPRVPCGAVYTAERAAGGRSTRRAQSCRPRRRGLGRHVTAGTPHGARRGEREGRRGRGDSGNRREEERAKNNRCVNLKRARAGSNRRAWVRKLVSYSAV